MINTKIEHKAYSFVDTIKRYEQKIKRLTRERDEYKRRNRVLEDTLESWKPAIRFVYNLNKNENEFIPY